MEFVNQTRRERVDMARLPSETIPAGKAGGKGLYGAFSAVWTWCLLEWRGDQVVLLDKDLCAIEFTETDAGYENTDWSQKDTARLRQEAAGFTDQTQNVYQRLLSAEQIATADDFHGTTFDMGFPVGYVERLHHLWQTHLATGAGRADE